LPQRKIARTLGVVGFAAMRVLTVGILAANAAGSLGARISRSRTGSRPITILNEDKVRSPGTKQDWVVVLQGGVADTDIEGICQHSPKACGLRGHPSSGGVPFLDLHATEEEMRSILRESAEKVQFVEPDEVVSRYPTFREAATASGQPQSASWGLDRVAAPERSSQGAGVHIYVLDTGVRVSHQDFSGRGVAALDVSSGSAVECEAGDASCARDRDGHGTHCAGTAAGVTFGVAPGSTVHGVKVLSDEGSGSWSWSYSALDWIGFRGQRPAVASMSLGGMGTQNAMKSAVDAAVASGVTVVVAAGNENSNACNFSPAFVPSAITVASSTSADWKSRFSNHGACVNIWAPGSSIVSASHLSDTGSDTLSGTSMACPHVSGGAALVLERNPGLTPQQVLASLKESAEFGPIKNIQFGSPAELLWVGSAPAPSPVPTPAPPAPATCPNFAMGPDKDKDCLCRDRLVCYQGDSTTPNCPTSSGLGAHSGRYFFHTCEDCRCDAKQGETTPKPGPQCPHWAHKPQPDSQNDCRCQDGQVCTVDGGSVPNCPTSGQTGGYGGRYFLVTCEDCMCDVPAA